MPLYRAPRRSVTTPTREYLIKARIDAQLTQEQVCDKISGNTGVVFNRSTIARWEAGIRNPGVDALHMLADIYGLACDYVMNEEYDFLKKLGLTA